jgi:predicted ester cyclase
MAVSTVLRPEGISNGELIRWAFERVNAHDVASLRQVWDDETVDRFPDRTCRGGDEIAAYFDGTFAGVPDFHLEILALAEQGEDVFVHWHLTGTHEGPLLGIAPTGKALDLEGIDHFVLRNGRVRSLFVAFDQLAYARQLKMMPPDGSTADRLMKSAFNARTKLMRRRHE